jgi:hypothetical protein
MQVARVDAAREVEMKIVDLSYTIETLPEDVPSQADLPYSQIERLTNLGAPSHRLHGRVLPAEDQARERRFGSRRGHPGLVAHGRTGSQLH